MHSLQSGAPQVQGQADVVPAAITRTQIDRNTLANGGNFHSQGKGQLSAVM